MYFRYLCIAAGFMIPVASLAQSDILTRQGNSGTVSGSLYGDGQSRTYNNPDIPDISPGSTGRGEKGDRTTGVMEVMMVAELLQVNRGISEAIMIGIIPETRDICRKRNQNLHKTARHLRRSKRQKPELVR